MQVFYFTTLKFISPVWNAKLRTVARKQDLKCSSVSVYIETLGWGEVEESIKGVNDIGKKNLNELLKK